MTNPQDQASFAVPYQDRQAQGQPEDQATAARHIPLPPEYTEAGRHSQPAPEDVAPAADSQPALAGVAPQFAGQDQDVEGVNADTMPEFRDMRRMLPAQRLAATMALGKVAATLPASLRDVAGEDGSVDLSAADLASITPEDMDGLANLFQVIQDIILDNAKDRQAMEDWLMDQEDPLQAVMVAFSRYQEALGN